jgi:hypothetical protein
MMASPFKGKVRWPLSVAFARPLPVFVPWLPAWLTSFGAETVLGGKGGINVVV